MSLFYLTGLVILTVPVSLLFSMDWGLYYQPPKPQPACLKLEMSSISTAASQASRISVKAKEINSCIGE